MKRIGLMHGAWLVLRKDWQIEWQTRTRFLATVSFGLCILLLFSFSVGPGIDVLRRHAPGYLWLALLFTSILALGESFRIENENDALTGLLLAPLDARALFIGKVLGNTSLLLALSLMLLPAVVALYDINIATKPAALVGTLALGCLGISAPGTVYAAITTHAQGRDVMLPLLLFPIMVPVLVAAISATTLAMSQDLQGQLPSWLKLLLAFDLIYMSLGLLVFPYIVEDD